MKICGALRGLERGILDVNLLQEELGAGDLRRPVAGHFGHGSLACAETKKRLSHGTRRVAA